VVQKFCKINLGLVCWSYNRRNRWYHFFSCWLIDFSIWDRFFSKILCWSHLFLFLTVLFCLNVNKVSFKQNHLLYFMKLFSYYFWMCWNRSCFVANTKHDLWSPATCFWPSHRHFWFLFGIFYNQPSKFLKLGNESQHILECNNNRLITEGIVGQSKKRSYIDW